MAVSSCITKVPMSLYAREVRKWGTSCPSLILFTGLIKDKRVASTADNDVLNATKGPCGPPVPIAINQSQDEEEIVEEAEGQGDTQGETQYSLLLREQLDAERDPEEEDEEDEDEEVSEVVVDLLNKATSTPRVSNRALQEDEREHPPASIAKRFSGIIGDGIRFFSPGSRANDNDINEDTSPAEEIDDTMQPPSTTTSASKSSKKLSRPHVLHQPLEAYKPSPRSSGKPDVYELNASPEKATSTPTRTESKQAQGVKRKRNNPAASKKQPPRGKAASSGLPAAASKVSEEIQSEAPHRVTRSRGSGEIVEPIDYSKKVEDTGKRKRASGAADDEPPSKEGSKRARKVVEDEDDEIEDEDEPGTPGRQDSAEGEAPAEQPTSPPTLQRAHSVEELPETTSNASDKGSQSGATSRPSDATARRTKKGKNASVKEQVDDQEYEDDGDDAEDSDGDEELESVGEGIPHTNVTNTKREPRGERQVSVKSPYFGDDFIADSNIEKVTNHVDRLEMTEDKADTVPGQEIQVLTRSIISSYESIQGLDEHDDPDPAARTEALCSAARDLDRLEAVVRKIIEKRLCDPAKLSAGARKKDVKWRTEMLKDLFLFVMPDIIRAASAAIFTYGSEGAPSTPDLKEILRYISLVSNLLLIVEDQHNKDFRPRAKHNATTPILKPYMSIKPLLQGFEMQCRRELRHREEVEEAIRQAPALEKARKEREAAREEQEAAEREAAEEAEREYQRRQDAIHEGFNRARLEAGLPPVTREGTQMSQTPQASEPPQPSQPQQKQELNITAHRIRAEEEVSALEKEMAALTRKLEVAERRATKLRREEQRQLRGYDAEETQEVDYERVEMFPAGNNHVTPVEPWTNTECEVLLDGLRLESGPDKYPNIARRLDRSLDEIFEKAMDFKRLMTEYAMNHGGTPEPWIAIIGNEMLPRGRKE
ncbi:hypothetical protein O988_03223 [Pseudogymnoascus sp. VKM F-3808]|nr:hypothetical protein O988_03223 [Pseudogymnoascus sp. VKM F-3808]